ncbi:zinc-dependent metalloproteinase lipoprotein [Porphyromonas sp.]|uniref:zinc-dependent metalloproteinase lipoprotein n=1 Tax=Porphyromonas sp. TaxID=1924944 RepID=UPI0026DC87F7|nr:zinc-dependent metalloproteinase lipoprotein [Porphyromonas sp.]MDO4771434.1 zinc-dependent metalloproteinase lipoprotein [Porphyromonas sp.]
MNTKLLYIFSILCLLLFSCKKDNEVSIGLSQDSIMDVPAAGGSYDIKVETSEKWVVKDGDRSWLYVAQYSKGTEQYIKIDVTSNLSESDRNIEIEILSHNSRRVLDIHQKGNSAGVELKYRIPVVFHVLYHDAGNKDQNIEQHRIEKTLREVNALYAQNDINLEFYLANIDPWGNVMKEAGIDRIKWVSSAVNPVDFMQTAGKEYIHLLWDPNRYVNVMMYNFSIAEILGIATFPLTPEQYPMDGMDIVEATDLKFADLDNMRAVSINSSWYSMEDPNPLTPYVEKELMKRQTSIATTLAHELGHYFGLRHVFSEDPHNRCGDTDFCADTPSYDKFQKYDRFIAGVFSDAVYNPNFANEFDWKSLFERESCDGHRFTSRNIMDYSFCYMDKFTADQKRRIRHVLDYSPFIPGPKKGRKATTRGISLKPVHIPHNIVICRLGDR